MDFLLYLGILHLFFRLDDFLENSTQQLEISVCHCSDCQMFLETAVKQTGTNRIKIKEAAN